MWRKNGSKFLRRNRGREGGVGKLHGRHKFAYDTAKISFMVQMCTFGHYKIENKNVQHIIIKFYTWNYTRPF